MATKFSELRAIGYEKAINALEELEELMKKYPCPEHTNLFKTIEKGLELILLNPVTGAPSYAKLERDIKEYENRENERRKNGALLHCYIAHTDINSFKKFNDCWGTGIGDKVIEFAVNTLLACLRTEDVFARGYHEHGDEKLVVIYTKNAIDAINALKRYKEAVEANSPAELQRYGILEENITETIGLTRWEDGEQFYEAEQRADFIMQYAKMTGNLAFMEFLSIQQAIKKGSGKVQVHGWVYRERKLANQVFIVLRDSTNIIQCLLQKDKVDESLWNEANKITIESSLKIEGKIRKEKRAPIGFEIDVSSLSIIHIAEPFPITKDQSTEFLADKRHLWLRSRKMASILKIRSTIFGAIHSYFRKNGFYEFQSPSLTPGVAEEGPTMFKVKYFDKELYLTQTWQMYAEPAIFYLEKIYCIAPSFRAEPSKTSRHLTEYWHAEAEMAWFDLNQTIELAENLVKHIVKEVIKNNKEELNLLNRDIAKLLPLTKKRFPRITYTEALKILKEKCNMEVPWGKDLRTIEEEKLMELYDAPVFVTHYPKEVMAFYKPSEPKNPKTALCFDLLAPEGNGELIGGSERDTNIESVKKSLKEKGEDIKNYEFYLDTMRYGDIPNAGFGLGVERMIKWICGLDNIKDAIAYPRTMERFTP
ncbi:asparagine--tRNA ligase [archaeon]|nr:asparagine--tRNA ligase [archaeon]